MSVPGFTAEFSLDSRQNYKMICRFENGAQDVRPALPCLYGKWCGPGCSGPDEPKDNVDACCRDHDKCYEERGYLSCSCDRELQRCIKPRINLLTAKGRAAGAVWTYFAGSPCNPLA